MTATKHDRSAWNNRIRQIDLAIRKHRMKVESLEREKEMLEQKLRDADEIQEEAQKRTHYSV